jgi:uncharacterized protein YjiS (DUF1127 family)
MTRLPADPKGRAHGPYDLFATGRLVWRMAKAVAQRIRNRRAVVRLLDLDDHALKDIGLTRCDVRRSLALPLREDPSTELRLVALERRAARLVRDRDYDGPVVRPQLRVVGGFSRSSSASTSR